MNDINDLDLYEDEPMASVRPTEFSGNEMVIENMDEVERKRQKRKRRRKKRLERLGKLAVCICCAGVIAAIVVTIVLTEAAIAVTSPVKPTLGPTPMPALPTYKPTVARPTIKVPKPTTKPPTQTKPTIKPATPKTPVPTFSIQDSYDIIASQDTYIFTEGKDVSRTYGKQETFLVQNGFRNSDDINDAIALLIFDMTQIPDFDLLAENGKKAILTLYHQPLDIIDRVRDGAPITVSRMGSTSLAIESLSGSSFKPKNFWDGPTVTVPTDATEITFDVTNLVYNTNFGQDQVFLMLETRKQEQENGDYFYSRESDNPPMLSLTGLMP